MSGTLTIWTRVTIRVTPKAAMGRNTRRPAVTALAALAGLLCAGPAPAADQPAGVTFRCSFARGQWKADDWIFGKIPTWEPGVKWAQEDDCIRNDAPAGVTPEELQGKRVADSRVSMVYRQPVEGDATITATMEFTPHMAPLIVLAPALGESNEPGVKQYEGAFEIVLWDEGVNVWQHFWENGKARYELAAYARFPLKPNTRYTLAVRKKGKDLRVTVDGHTFGFLCKALPERFYAGITACEGSNRFYDFSIVRP